MRPNYKTTLETPANISGRVLTNLENSLWEDSKRDVLEYFDRNALKIFEIDDRNINLVTSFHVLDAHYPIGLVLEIEEKYYQDQILVNLKGKKTDVISARMKIELASDYIPLDGLVQLILRKANGFLIKMNEKAQVEETGALRWAWNY